MSLEPKKIYLHDPYGCFDEDTNCDTDNTVEWSEERISENDYEYIRVDKNNLLNDNWIDINDKSYYNESRILIFSPCYDDPIMRYRIIDSQFMDLCKEATHWMKLRDVNDK